MDGLTCDEFLETIIQEKVDFLDRKLFSLENSHNEMLKEFDKYTKMLIRAKKTENYGPITRYIETPRFKDVLEPFNENSCPNIGKDSTKNGINNNPTMETVRVKTEKLSISSAPVSDSVNMPAPKMPPPKVKRVKKEPANLRKVKKEPMTESDSSAGSKKATRSNTERVSDVILQNPVIPVVDLSESIEGDDEVSVRSTRTGTKKKTETAPVRTTRARTKKAVKSKDDEEDIETPARTTRTKTRSKRERSASESQNGIVEHKRTKSDSSAADDEPLADQLANNANEPMMNISSHTEYEDAVSQLENRPNETFVVPANMTPNTDNNKPNIPLLNQTVVLDKAKVQQADSNNTADMITDDESIEEQVVASPQKKAQANLKEVFSPYKNSPVKKKVEAFEKFQHNENVPVSKMNTSRMLREIEENKGNVKEKAKGFTGASTSMYKTNPPSASKIGKYIGHKTSVFNGSMSSKVLTPLSGHDFKEREAKRLEKEKELKKREMLKQAQMEEKKRKYEEKMIKRQELQKQAKEKELEKALEIQRIKEDRVKLVLQQKEERQRQLKEENERKRLLAKQRAEEKRKEEEAARLALHGKIEQKKNIETDSSKNKSAPQLPIYMLQPTPPLPCLDCYDSDDERFSDEKNIPSWASRSRVKTQDYIQTSLGHRIKNTLFCCQSQNIDLIDVFQRIDARKLKRTSSARWDRPPRFTLLPSLTDD